MSEAESGTEELEPHAVSEAEQLNSATVPKQQWHSKLPHTETVTKIKKVATPKQLEALRLARFKRMGKAAARKVEYAKLIEKVGVEQSDSESPAGECAIKRVRKDKKVTKEVVATPTTVTPATPQDESSDGDSDHAQTPPQIQQKKKKTRQTETTPPPEAFALNFV